MESGTRWTDADFESMSWHDNHVHGLELREGENGAGELMLDLDYILEWICADDGSCTFRIVPVRLTFHEVHDLRIALDYAAAQASLGPFSLAGIARDAGAHGVWRWRLAVNWPQGSLEFAARGFTQLVSGPEVVKAVQSLTAGERLG